MKYIKEQKFEKNNNVKMTVVYLTLIPGKTPDIDSYDQSFEYYKRLIMDAKNGIDRKVLKYRSAIDSNKKKGNLVKFLDDCLLFIKSKDITSPEVMLTKVDLEQYKILLGHLGGSVAMFEYQKELLKSIYSSEKNYKAAKDLVEVFAGDKNGENSIVSSFITDQLKNFVEPLGFYFNDWGYVITNDITSDYLYVFGQFRNLQIGFTNDEEKISEEHQKIYQKILEEVYKIRTDGADDKWVWLQIEPLNGKENLNEFLKFYTDLLVEVKERFLKVR